MTNTTITNPSDTTYQTEATGTRRPVRTVARAAVGIAAGFAFGCLAASVVIDTGVSTVVPAVSAVPEAAPVRPAMSPDAIGRWAEHAEAVSVTPTVSPDAAERAALAEAARQARIDEFACLRASRGMADC